MRKSGYLGFTAIFYFAMVAHVPGHWGRGLTDAIRTEITSRSLDHLIHTTRTCCNGRCKDKSVLVVYPAGTWYRDMKPEDALYFIESLFEHDVPLREKVSFQYNGEQFERTQGTEIGDVKS